MFFQVCLSFVVTFVVESGNRVNSRGSDCSGTVMLELIWGSSSLEFGQSDVITYLLHFWSLTEVEVG